ncbi:MAG: cytochrome c oxidase assembly protein [Burkholderiaceae bacterium]
MVSPADVILPYCGSAPSPGELAMRWNFDPLLLALLSTTLVAYLAGAWRLRHVHRSAARGADTPSTAQQGCFIAGWSIAALALVSPLCALSVALFSARVAQHLLLMLVAAPLVMLGRPAAMFAALGLMHGFPRGANLAAAWLAFTLLLWGWHTPGPYQASFGSDAAYWAMHLSLFASACLLWGALFARGARSMPAAMWAGVASGMQMGLLGALLTFAPRALYPVHELSAIAWGLSALEDQQLGGLLMWVPGGLLMLVAAMIALGIALRDDEGGGLRFDGGDGPQPAKRMGARLTATRTGARLNPPPRNGPSDLRVP